MSGGQLWWGAPWGCLQRWKHCCCLKMKLEIELQGNGFGLHWAHPGQLSSAPSGSPYLCFAGSCRYIIFTYRHLHLHLQSILCHESGSPNQSQAGTLSYRQCLCVTFLHCNEQQSQIYLIEILHSSIKANFGDLPSITDVITA